jgi:hypothetical protein
VNKRLSNRVVLYLLKHVVVCTNGCWLWLGTVNNHGYGKWCLRDSNHGKNAHRGVYESFCGRVAAGLDLDHLCRNRWCVNPTHLEPVTHAENMRRSIYGAKTHCIRGHKLSGKNLYVMPSRPGWRYCVACRKMYRAQHKSLVKKHE